MLNCENILEVLNNLLSPYKMPNFLLILSTFFSLFRLLTWSILKTKVKFVALLFVT